MAIKVEYFIKTIGGKDFAFEPGDINIGEGQSVDVQINRGGVINEFSISKTTITFTIRGALGADVETLDAERSNNLDSLIAGTAVGEDIPIAGRIIEEALIYKVTPSAPRIINGIEILEQVQVEYRSQVFS